MKLKFIVFIITISLCKPITTFAWGKDGHHMIMELAYHLLSVEAREKLNVYLNGMSIDDASVWMDVEKRTSQYGYLKHTHYIDIDIGQQFNPNLTDNIYFELTKVTNELNKHPSQNDATIDFLILIHLIGDLHQPLHVGYSTDKGGNTIPVFLDGRAMNLHEAWDSGIIKERHITIEDILQIYSTTSKAKIDLIKQGDLQDWLLDTRSTLNEVYSFKSNNFDDKYLDNATIVIKNQILKAGIRLSILLEKLVDEQPKPNANSDFSTKSVFKKKVNTENFGMINSNLLELYIIGGIIIVLIIMGFYYYFKK